MELRHIQLELQHNRFHHLRHFVDQYFCYKKGFLTRGGRPDWEGIVWKGIVSVDARAREPNRDLVVRDHAVPLQVIQGRLKELIPKERLSLGDIAEVLDSLTHFGTITKEEDAKLRSAGLDSSMPAGFSESGHPYFGDVLAGYKQAGIRIEAGIL